MFLFFFKYIFYSIFICASTSWSISQLAVEEWLSGKALDALLGRQESSRRALNSVLYLVNLGLPLKAGFSTKVGFLLLFWQKKHFFMGLFSKHMFSSFKNWLFKLCFITMSYTGAYVVIPCSVLMAGYSFQLHTSLSGFAFWD